MPSALFNKSVHDFEGNVTIMGDIRGNGVHHIYEGSASTKWP